MIIQILFVIFMVLWMLTHFPAGPHTLYPWASGILAWPSVLMLGLWLFLPMARG